MSEVNCLSDMSEVVRASSNVNVPQHCGNEQGDVFVPMYNFSSVLARYFKRFLKKPKSFTISSLHHQQLLHTNSLETQKNLNVTWQSKHQGN